MKYTQRNKEKFNQIEGTFGQKNRAKNIKNNQELRKSNRIAKGDKKNPKRALTRIANDEYVLSGGKLKDSKTYKGSAKIFSGR